MSEIRVTMEDEDAATLHRLTSRVLEAWEGEEGPHVERLVGLRRRIEAALRSHGWAPAGDGLWTQDRRPMRGRR